MSERKVAIDYRRFMDEFETMYRNHLDAVADAVQSGAATYGELSIANGMATDAYQLSILRTIAECQMMQVQQMERIANTLERLASPADKTE